MRKNDPVVVAQKNIFSTNDYSIFKGMDGNRDVDEQHVLQLQKLMLANGNLTYEFPIVVNSEMYVIDGQHRLKALQDLGWEVGYIVQDQATIETVRAINRGNRNWSWRDVANSYAKLGNKEYEWFLWFTETYNLTLGAATAFTTGFTRGSRKSFMDGSFKITHKTEAVNRAEQYAQIREEAGVDSAAFAAAFAEVNKSPYYDHERMSRKVAELAQTIPERATVADYKRKFEEVFNHKLAEDSRVRLF